MADTILIYVQGEGTALDSNIVFCFEWWASADGIYSNGWQDEKGGNSGKIRVKTSRTFFESLFKSNIGRWLCRIELHPATSLGIQYSAKTD